MKILTVENKKDKNQNDYKSITLDDGRKIFYIGKDHSRYEEISPEAEISEATMEQDGKFWRLKDMNRPQPSQNRKETSINNFQKQKEENIKMISASRDATLIMVELIKKGHDTEDVIKEEWKRWREWFYSQYNAPFV